jgi:hypothetical protein
MSGLAFRSPMQVPGEATDVMVGDLVRTGENFHPHYEVIAVTHDRAWIRDTQYGSDHVVPIDRCRRIELPSFRRMCGA